MPDSRTTLFARDLVRIAAVYRRRWLLPAGLVAASVIVFALIRPDTWEASQRIIVRNEAAGNLSEPGKFRQPEDMKTAQETILQMAQSREVLRQALLEVGPPADADVGPAWPTAIDLTDLAETISLAPPKGSEFGKTEVLYLNVKESDPSRGLALVAAITRQLQARLQQLREARAQGMIDELSKAASLAEADLQTTTQQLSQLESSVGADLAELRTLLESSSGESDLRRKSETIETELRAAQLEQSGNRGLLALLESATHDHGQLLATPSRLLESQPSLKRLKEGLVDAQLHTAELAGNMSERHPLVKAAIEAEREIGTQLHRELEIACRGVRVELELSAARVERLSEQLAETRGRLGRLAGLRASYGNLITAVKNRAGLLEAAQRELAEARGSQAGAHSASLLYSVDAPQLSARPIGPSRLTLCLLGVASGLMVGGGVLFLTVDLSQATSHAVVSSRPQPARTLEPLIAAFAPINAVPTGSLQYPLHRDRRTAGAI